MNESGSVRGVGKRLNERERELVNNHPMLGEMPDTRLGKICNVSKFTIARARREKGIPPFAQAKRVRPVGENNELLRRWRR